MADLDDRLERAFRRAAMLPPRDSEGVATAVALKRQRRRARRRAATSLAVATVVVTALATTAVIVTRDTSGDGGPDVVATGPTTPPSTPPVSEPPDQTPSTVPPAVQESAEERVPENAPSGYEVPPGEVTVVASGEAVASATDATGTTYEGVRFEETEPGEWSMTTASTCRLPGADPAACSGVTPEIRVTPGKTRLDPTAYAGAAASVDELTLDSELEYVRGPLLERDDLVWASAYRRVGTEHDYPPSEVLLFDPVSGAVLLEVSLQGEVMSLARDGDDLWALTHERRIDADGVEHRVKRIDAQGTVDSMEVPPGSVPAGPIVATAGRAWVPVGDGVLAFSASVTDPTGSIALPKQDTRGLGLIDEAVYVTGGTTIRRLDPARGRATGVLDTRASAPLIDLVAAGDQVIALAADGQLLWLDRDLTNVEAVGSLPPGMAEAELHVAGDRMWATGTADLAPAGGDSAQSVAVEPVAVVLDESGIEATLVIAGGQDADVAVLTTGELLLTSGGNVYRVTLPT
jgi:hypothetical protein